MKELDVYLYGERVAALGQTPRGLRLEYTPEQLQRGTPIPLSVLLPVVPGPQPEQIVANFLDNLLPDSPEVRRRWAQEARLPNDSPFELLGAYGADVAGAITFAPAGTRPQRGSQLAPLTDAHVADRIRAVRADASDWGTREISNHPFSLGGAQGKFALARHDGQWYEPTGDAPSTHIFKPGVAGYPGSDVTEHLIMRAAGRFNIHVAETSIEMFDDERVLVVQRFDRLVVGDTVQRLHQEDLAQVTGTPTYQKYEHSGGPGYLDIFAAFDAALDVKESAFAKAAFAINLVFSWIVGHNDGHAKNYSIFHLPNAHTMLTPFYDLNSILPYQAESIVRARQYEAFDGVGLAFTVAGASAIGDYTADTLEHLARDAGLQPGSLSRYALRVASQLMQTVNEEIDALPKAAQQLVAVQNLPHVLYAQTRRVTEVLGGHPS